MTAEQLILNISLGHEATFANFHSGKNTLCVEALKLAAHGEGERLIFLSGALGEGRSHLLQAACHEANEYKQSCIYIPLAEVAATTVQVFEGVEALSLVCIDDIELIATRPGWEEAMFHCYNRIMDAGARLLVAGKAPPKQLGLQLADLVSRLSWGILFQLQPLMDEEKLAVLVERATRRGMHLPPEVGRFLLTHAARDLVSMLSILDELDRASLMAQRRLTIPFVKSVLQI